MTTRAYQETYLSKAQAALGDAFDYAINTCRISGADCSAFAKDPSYGTVSSAPEGNKQSRVFFAAPEGKLDKR